MMARRFPGRRATVAAACLAAAGGLSVAPWASGASPRARGPWGVAYAPREGDAAQRSPAIVYLHGMWASPEDSCGYFVRSATVFGFLVCPRGNAPLGEGRMWSGTYASVAPAVHAALDAAAGLAPGRLDRSGEGTLIGYSNGAYFAVEIACAERGSWTGLILLSMHLEPDMRRLRDAGVRRVVLGAGERDGTRASMQALVERGRKAGLATRFVSLGPGGHELPNDMDARMCEAVAWVRGADPGDCSSPSGAFPSQ